jgi:DNA-binding FadR family transcriptional regulator
MATTDDTRNRSRAEVTADQIGTLAKNAAPGTRLGSRDDLRQRCGVSVGTLHEALRLLQSTGEITVRTGPGGGIFAGSHSALAGLLRDVRHEAQQGNMYTDTSRVLTALAPLILGDAIGALDTHAQQTLRNRLNDLRQARTGNLQAFIRASLELFATIVSIPPAGLTRAIASAIIRAQIELLPHLTNPIDHNWKPLADAHLNAVTDMVNAITNRNLDHALKARLHHEFDAIFTQLQENSA